MEFYIFVYKACAVSLYTILVREVDGRFVTLFFNMSQNDLKRPNRILLIFSAIHIKSLAFRFATPISYFSFHRHLTFSQSLIRPYINTLPCLQVSPFTIRLSPERMICRKSQWQKDRCTHIQTACIYIRFGHIYLTA